MIPELKFGDFSLSTYWLMLAIGAVGMLICLWQRRKRFSMTIWQCMVFTVLLTATGFGGAKLLFILENIQDTQKNGISLGGVSFFGSVFLIPLLMPLIGKLFRLRNWQTMDICAPCVAIMIGCMRVGCFLTGCCGGWEVCIRDFCFHWPTQALESIGDFVILGWLLRCEERDAQKGILYPLFMLSYSLMRFFIEFLRATPKDWLLLSHGQWYSLIAILIGLLWHSMSIKTNSAAVSDSTK